MISHTAIVVRSGLEQLTPKTSWLDAPVAPDQESSEHWLGHDIQNTVEHGLGVRCDDVATLRQSPGNWVQEPQEDGPNTANLVGLEDVRADSGGVLACGPDDGPGDPEECDASEDKVSPLHTSLIKHAM